MVAEVVPNGNALSRARELAELYLNAPEVTRRNTRIHFIQPLKERIVREVGYGLSLEGASSADLVKSMPTNREPVARPDKVYQLVTVAELLDSKQSSLDKKMTIVLINLKKEKKCRLLKNYC